MEELLAWIRARTIAEAAVASLAVNVAVFAATLAIGALIVSTWRERRVARVPAPIDRTELGLAAVCVLLNAAVMLAGWWLFRAGHLRVDASPSPLRWLVDAAALTLIMDVAMYATHRLAHVEPLYRWVHAIHHRYEHPRPLTLFVLHPIEVLGFGGLWLMVLLAHRFSLGGMVAYLTLNTLFGVVGHVGVEPLPAGLARLPIVRAIGSSTFHAVHHQRGTTNFGFYTALWDRLFRTLDPSAGGRAAADLVAGDAVAARIAED